MANKSLDKEWVSKEVKEIYYPKYKRIRARYDKKERYRMQDDSLVIRQMKPRDMTPTPTKADLLHKVQGFEHQRPDVLANKYYGDPRMYWIILAANGLRDPLDLTRGMSIRIPDVNSLYTDNGVMNR